MKKAILGIALTLVLAACAENDVIEKSREMVFPNCTNDFFLVFNESTTFAGSDSTTKVTLEVKSSKLNRKFRLDRVSNILQKTENTFSGNTRKNLLSERMILLIVCVSNEVQMVQHF